MAQRLPVVLAAIVLLLASVHSEAQPPGQPPPPPVADKPKPPEPAPAAKELSKEEVDAMIEKAFGKDSAEMKRPIRLWIWNIPMVIAAENATIVGSGLGVRFNSANAALFDGGIYVFRDNEIDVVGGREVTSIEMRGMDRAITLSSPTAPPAAPPSPNAKRVIPPSAEELSERGPVFLHIRFKFKIDPKTSLADLLPTPMKTSAKSPPWTNEDLAKVPELTFGEAISKELPKHKAMEATAHTMAKINYLNAKKRDGFMLAML